MEKMRGSKSQIFNYIKLLILKILQENSLKILFSIIEIINFYNLINDIKIINQYR